MLGLPGDIIALVGDGKELSRSGDEATSPHGCLQCDDVITPRMSCTDVLILEKLYGKIGFKQ